MKNKIGIEFITSIGNGIDSWIAKALSERCYGTLFREWAKSWIHHHTTSSTLGSEKITEMSNGRRVCRSNATTTLSAHWRSKTLNSFPKSCLQFPAQLFSCSNWQHFKMWFFFLEICMNFHFSSKQMLDSLQSNFPHFLLDIFCLLLFIWNDSLNWHIDNNSFNSKFDILKCN